MVCFGADPMMIVEQYHGFFVVLKLEYFERVTSISSPLTCINYSGPKGGTGAT